MLAIFLLAPLLVAVGVGLSLSKLALRFFVQKNAWFDKNNCLFRRNLSRCFYNVVDCISSCCLIFREGIQIRLWTDDQHQRSGKTCPISDWSADGLSEVEMLKRLQKKDERYKKGIENRFRAKSAVHTENQTN